MQGPEQILLTGRVHPISLEVRPLQLENTQARILGLRDGQIIQATLEMRGDSLKLLLNGQLFDLPPGMRLRAGDTVWLRAQARTGHWLLRPLDARSAAAAEQALPANAVETPQPAAPQGARPAAVHLTPSRLQALLLRPPLSSELMGLLQPREAAALLKAVGDAELVALFQRLQLSMRGLSPGAVQSGVLSSGLWLEAMLARGQQGGSPLTVKTLLRRLLQAIGERESPDRARLARAIDDIESSQVDSVRAQSRGELFFSMVIPFSDANPVALEFSRPARRPGRDEEAPFTASLHTRHAMLGEIWLQFRLIGANQVDLMMWALSAETAAAARRQARQLGQLLGKAGLSLGTYRVFNAPRPSALPAAAPPGTMLDVQT